jgi:GNAT superfamily N-acetyltransferase
MDPLELARLEERRQAIGTAEICPVAEPIAGGMMTYSEPGSWSNQAVGLGLDGPVSAGEIDRFIAFYERRGVEPRIEVCPYADPSLLAQLAERRFVLREFESVWARPTGPDMDPASIMTVPWPSDPVSGPLVLRRVDASSPADVRTAAETAYANFLPEPRPLTPKELEQQRLLCAHERNDVVLAEFAGVPVGVGGMESAPPIACLFGMGTLPPCRRRGVQQAVMAWRIARAGRRGCTAAIIHSRPGIATERNARRMGFSLAYTKVLLTRPGPGLAPSP